MSLLRKLWSPAGFVLVGICFLFPFFAASCSVPDEDKTHDFSITYSGLDFVVGGHGDQVAPSELQRGVFATAGLVNDTATPSSDVLDPMTPQLPAIVAVVLVALGVLTVVIRRQEVRAAVSAALAFAAGVSLYLAFLAVKEDFDDALVPSLTDKGIAAFSTQPQWGLWTAWGLLLVLMVSNVDAWVRARFKPRPVTPAE